MYSSDLLNAHVCGMHADGTLFICKLVTQVRLEKTTKRLNQYDILTSEAKVPAGSQGHHYMQRNKCDSVNAVSDVLFCADRRGNQFDDAECRTYICHSPPPKTTIADICEPNRNP